MRPIVKHVNTHLASIIQPKVAEAARLPWVWCGMVFQSHRGCVSRRTPICHNPVGVDTDLGWCSQGIALLNPGLSDLAPLGQTKRPSQSPSVAELGALLPAILDRAFKGEL